MMGIIDTAIAVACTVNDVAVFACDICPATSALAAVASVWLIVVIILKESVCRLASLT